MIYTLKEMVDVILSAMDSDEVNSISDTVESNQVALLLKSVYYDIATDINLPEHNSVFELTASGDNNLPTLMTLPTNVTRLDNIRYDNKADADTYPDYQPVLYCDFLDFVARMQSHREDTTGVGSMDITLDSGDTHTVLYLTDRDPTFYTIVDDKTVLFNAYDSNKDTTLQKSKTLCEGALYPTFTLSDNFTPDLDPTQFAYYLNSAKVRAFAELKQTAHQEAAGTARRQRVIIQKRKQRTPDFPEVLKVKARYGKPR